MQAESAFANHQFLFIISQYAGRMRSRRFDLEIFLNDLFRSAGRIQSLHFLHTDYQACSFRRRCFYRNTVIVP